MVAKFLGGLAHDYSTTKIFILTNDEIPNLFEAFNKLNWLALSTPTSNESNSSGLVVIGGRGRGSF